MESTKILKIQNEDKSSTYRIKSEWENDNFKLLVLVENSTAWRADVNQQYLSQLAEQRGQNVVDYYNNIKQNLTQPGSDIVLDIKQNDDSAEFLIKRKAGGRTILIFSTNLEKQDFQESAYNIIDELFKEKLILDNKLEDSEKRHVVLEKEKQTCQEKLSEFVEAKTNWEQEMYSNFLILLNEKKKRIKFLTDLLQRKKINPDEVKEYENHSVPTSPKAPPKSNKKLETISDSDSKSEYETDKEENADDDDESHIEIEPSPSTSKHTLEIDSNSPPVLCLPKLSIKAKQKQVPQKIKHTQELTSTVLTENTQSTEDPLTQKPLSTQDLLDRL